MSEKFDPLHRWLGIPPEEQPPTHYRLLGLKAFEQDAAVVEAAVEQRMAYVRQAAAGTHADHSQAVLNLLATAQGCLLDEEKKAVYDQKLRARQLKTATPLAVAKPLPVAQPLASPPPIAPAPGDWLEQSPTKSAATHTPKGRSGKTAQSASSWPLYVGVGAGAMLLVVVVGFLGGAFSNSSTPEKEHAQLAEKGAGTGSAPPPPAMPQELPEPSLPAATNVTPEATEPKQPAEIGLPPVELRPGGEAAPLKPAPEPEKLRLPILKRRASDAILLVCGGEEFNTAAAVCQKYNLKYEHRGFDRQLYSGIHAILVGTNRMDYWGASAEAKQPEAFQAIDQFVNEGGHLVVMGAFNGRNMHHLAKYGIQTATSHCDNYSDVPERTAVFLKGAEDVAPANKALRSAGNFIVKQPHVMLMQRSPTNTEPVLVTLAAGKGRVTFTLAEPEWFGHYWFVTALTRWIARGGPTLADDEEIPLRAPVLAQANAANDLPPLPGLPEAAGALPTEERLPVPAAEALKEAAAQLKDVFGDQFKAKAPAEKKAFAESLLKTGLESASDPPSQYALYSEACEQALAIKDTALALQAIDALAARFAVDGAGLKVDALTRLAKGVREPQAIQAIVKQSLDLCADMIDTNDFAQASRLMTLAVAGAPRSQSKYLIGITPVVDKRVKQLVREFERVGEHLGTLKKTPADPVANLEVGRFLCFSKGDWPNGLPLLAKSSQAKLKSLAARELSDAPAGVDAKKMGDDWLAAASELAAPEQAAARFRARLWYRRAVATVKGLGRAEVEAKLAELPSPRVQLTFAVEDVHGDEAIHITPEKFTWQHLTWGMPAGAVVNDLPWNINKELTLRNRGATQLLPLDVDVTSVRVRKLRGRGPVTATSTENEAVISVSDGPDGYDDYEFVVQFGK